MSDDSILKKLLASGEEQIGRIAGQLMSNEKFIAGVQSAVTSAIEAKGVLDKQLQNAVAAMHVPSAQDIGKLNERLDELERIFEGLVAKVDAIAEKLEQEQR